MCGYAREKLVLKNLVPLRSRAELVTESLRQRIEQLRSNNMMNNNNTKNSKEE